MRDRVRDDPRQGETRCSIECVVFGLSALLPARRDHHVEVGQLAVGRDVSSRDDFFGHKEFSVWAHHAAAVRENNHSAGRWRGDARLALRHQRDDKQRGERAREEVAVHRLERVLERQLLHDLKGAPQRQRHSQR